jgi:DNA-binding transcriptional regulator PaaX
MADNQDLTGSHQHASTDTPERCDRADISNDRPVKPASIILDLLRTYAERGTSAANIMATGAMFGFSGNRMRVGLSRLVARQTIENFRRGYYRLNRTTDPFNTFVERWRLGEARMRPWDQRWLLIHRGDGLDHTKGIKGEWALTHTGFCEISKNCWIRPDNLVLTPAELEQQLHYLGLENGAIGASGAELNRRWQQRWLAYFEPEKINNRYRKMYQRLTNSLNELPNLGTTAAMKSSFQLGGQAIEILATDPLLPAELIDTSPRESLWRLMLEYDRVGREFWASADNSIPITMPSAQIALKHAR